MLEKTTRLILLYDFYQDLLTEKQKQFTKLYFEDDFSLAEIAEEFKISRQAVYEHIKRSETLLLDYESKLHLLEKHESKLQLLDEIEHLLEQYNENNHFILKEKISLLRRID